MYICAIGMRWRRSTLRINYIRELNGQTKKAATAMATATTTATQNGYRKRNKPRNRETVDINERAYSI